MNAFREIETNPALSLKQRIQVLELWNISYSVAFEDYQEFVYFEIPEWLLRSPLLDSFKEQIGLKTL